MNVPRSRATLFRQEITQKSRIKNVDSTFFQTVRERARKVAKCTNEAETAEANPSTSRDDEEASLLTSTGSCITGRLFIRSSSQRAVQSRSHRSGSDRQKSLYDIIEGVNSDYRMNSERQPFRVSFKPAGQPDEADSFFVGLLDNPLEEVVQPDPDDYVTPVRKQRMMNYSTMTPSISRITASGSNLQTQMDKSASHEGFPMPDPSEKPSSSSIFKIPQTVPPRFSAKCVNEDISVYEAILNTPHNYTSLPKLSTPIFDHEAARRATSRSSRIPQSRDTSTSGVDATRNKLSANQGKSSTTPTSDTSYVIIGISSGRGCAIGEIGIAAIDLKRPSFILSQYSDSQTYQKTLAKLNIYQPAEVLIPDTLEASHNDLFCTIMNYFKDIKIVSVKRQYFNSEQGLQALKNLCNEDYSSVELIITNKYYSLCAASAVVMYVEHKHRTTFVPHSLKVSYESVQGSVIIDVETARRLELVTSENNIVQPTKYTLFGLMNNTVTVGGQRRLRAEILQPYSSRHIIEKRLDMVKYLVENESILGALQKALSKFSSVERLLWMCTKNRFINGINSNSESTSRAKRRANDAHICEILTNYILLLKQNVDELSELKEVLNNIDQDCFINIKDKLDDERYNSIKEKIAHILHEDSKPVRGFQAAELNRCFCIKQEINGLLDAARVTYSKLVDNMQDLIASYSEQCGLEMSLCLTSDLGFHMKFVLGKRQDPITFQLPPIFTNIKRRGKVYHASTPETFNYNARINRVVQEIQLITNAVLLELLEDLRSFVGCVYNLCEIVSELDVISSLAVVSCQKDYVRPTFSSELNVIAGRHPILDKFDRNPIPNNTYASRNKNFNIITGPNMAGKSVYILQVALLQLIAQIGSYVPATSAEFRVTDHIFVRKGLIDNLQYNASSFITELKEIMFTIENLGDSSLIILDEICSGVNSEEGTAVAWAICEGFLRRPAFTFLTTHYHFLTNLEKVYPNVTNYQMEAIERTEGSRFGPLVYTYRLIDGFTKISNYGIRLLLQTALPESIKMDAVKFTEQIIQRRAKAFPIVKALRTDQTKLMARVDEIEEFMNQLYKASLDDEKFTLPVIRKFQKLALRKFLNKENKEENIHPSSVKITEISDETGGVIANNENIGRKNGNEDKKDGKENSNSQMIVQPQADKTTGVKAESLPLQLISLHTTSSSSGPSTVTI